MLSRTALISLPLLLCVAACADVPAPPSPPPGVTIVDDFSYPDSQAAAEAWRAMSDQMAPAEVVDLEGRSALKLTCNFAGTTIPRGAWDKELSLDLSVASAFSFDVYAGNLQAVSNAHLYIRSGPGWYGCEWYPQAEGRWCHVRLRKSHFHVDRPGAGWARIDAIRFSPWALKREDATLYIANLAVESSAAPALILRQEYTDPAKSGDQANANRFTQTVADLLEDSGISLPVVNSPDLTAEILAAAEVVLMPYASGMEPETVQLLADFIDGGGKIIACFSAPGPIAERLGIATPTWRGAAFPGEFSAMHLVEGELPEVPRVLGQSSWGVLQVEPVADVGRVAAWWHSKDGERTDAPAIVISESGAYVSHVILDDDPAGKRALLKELIARHCPQVRGQAAEARVAALGTGLGAVDWEAASKLVRAQPAYSDRAAAALGKAHDLRTEALAVLEAGRHNEAFGLAEQADHQILRAFCLAQRSLWPEFRATWCHPVQGIAGQSWDETAALLKQSGIDHLLLNALHGASAGYESEVLPTDATLPAGSNAFARCIAACRKHDIKLHVWMTNYQTHGHAPAQFVEQLRAEGRLQVDVNGETSEQLCPSDDRNVALQRDAMVEAALIEGVAGVHFDYIRYPDERTCTCPTCRAKFEARIGREIGDWPGEVTQEAALREQWLQFRCDQITRLVREVSREVRRVAPNCLISAAVFSNYPQCRTGVGQDWKLWIDEGLLDFVCPMNYTGSDAEFASRVRSQLEIVAGKVPCYPGIGLLEHRSPADAVRQIEITRRLNTGGFVIWSVYPQYMATYPLLGLGVTAR